MKCNSAARAPGSAAAFALGGALLAAPCVAGADPRPSPVTFAVEPVGESWRWRFSLQNHSGSPVEVVVDRRLVWFEAEAPEVLPGARVRRAPRLPRCVHEARPTSNEGARTRRLAAGERYAEEVDLRDLCGLRFPPALVEGQRVVPHYGYAAPRRPTVLRSIVRDEEPEGVIDVRAAPLPWRVATDESADRGGASTDGVPLGLAGGSANAAMASGLRVTVRVTNPSRHPVRTLWRSTMFSFEVERPDGTTAECNAITRMPPPLRDLYARLGGLGRRSLVVSPATYCPAGLLDRPGVYPARVIFEAPAAPPEVASPSVFSGRVRSPQFVLRVARGRGAYVPLNPSDAETGRPR